MQVRGLMVAVVLLAALGGAVWWSEKAKKAEEGKPSKDAAPKIVEIPEDQIQQVTVNRSSGESSTIVKKNEAGKWVLTAPKPLPVDQDTAKSMMTTLSSLSSDRVVEDKATDWSQYGLAKPLVEVIVGKKDGKNVKLYFGDETPTGSAAFAKVDGDPRVFAVATYNKSSIDKSSKDLRDKRLLTFDSDKLSRVELAAKGQPVEFGKNAKSEWTILKPKPLRADNFQVEDLVRKLKDAKMDTSVSDEDAKKFASAFASGTKVAVAKVTDASGAQEIEVHKDKDKNYYAKSSVVEGFHKITADIGDGLDKALDDFRNKKLFEFGFNDPTKVEVKDGAKVYSYTKSGDKWMAGGRQMDSTGVQSLVDKLRDLSSIKFLDTAAGTPLLELTVVSQDGKNTEKVAVTKQGNSYYARRENEPAVYELDGKVVEEIQKTTADVKEFQPPKDQKKDTQKK